MAMDIIHSDSLMVNSINNASLNVKGLSSTCDITTDSTRAFAKQGNGNEIKPYVMMSLRNTIILILSYGKRLKIE